MQEQVVKNVIVVVDRENDTAFIEWHDGESPLNVLDALSHAEKQGVVFDLSDRDLWEDIAGQGVRLYGMFLDDILGEE